MLSPFTIFIIPTANQRKSLDKIKTIFFILGQIQRTKNMILKMDSQGLRIIMFLTSTATTAALYDLDWLNKILFI